jgi:hypothetical protein
MRVRLHQGGWEDVGAVRYKVEWETVKPEATSNDFNYDEDLAAHCRYFPESEYGLAQAFARHVLNHEQPFCGLVTITKQAVTWFVEEDKVAQWQDSSDPGYVDSPTAQNSSGE